MNQPLSEVRRQVLSFAAAMAASPGQPDGETVLLERDFLVGRRFVFERATADWLYAESHIRLYDAAGRHMTDVALETSPVEGEQRRAA